MGVRAAFVAYVDLGGVRRTSLTPAVRPKFGVSAPTAVVFGMKVGALVVGALLHGWRSSEKSRVVPGTVLVFIIFARVVRPEFTHVARMGSPSHCIRRTSDGGIHLAPSSRRAAEG